MTALAPSHAAPTRAPPAPPSAWPLLGLTFFASVSGGSFWSAMFFVTARKYHFSPLRNLVLGAAMGAAYAIVAYCSHAIGEKLARRLSARGFIAAALLIQGAVAALGVLLGQFESVFWITAMIGAASSALLWPRVQSFLSAGRHGAQMRQALGIYNVTWTVAVMVPMWLTPLVASIDIGWAIGMAALVNLVALAFLPGLPRAAAAHDETHAQSALGREYPFLMRSTRWLLPLSYVLLATLAPLLPHRLHTLHIPRDFETIAAATWMLARVLTLIVLWRVHFWQGRWSVLWWGGAALCGGLGLILLAPSQTWLMIGLTVFGIGLGSVYYVAIYYAQAVGRATVSASSAFEGRIGLGYLVGPLLGMLGEVAGGQTATLISTWAFVALAAVPITRPYLEARRGRPDPERH